MDPYYSYAPTPAPPPPAPHSQHPPLIHPNARFQEWDDPAAAAAPRSNGSWSAGSEGSDTMARPPAPPAPPLQPPPPPPGVELTLGGLQGLTQVADKSCTRCRVRKVKCDRRYPLCSRCDKRGESCEYKEDVSLAIQLQGSTSAPNASPAPPKREIDDDYRPSPTAQHFSPYARPAIPSRLDQSYSAYPSSSNALVGRREEDDNSTDLTALWDKFIRSNIGEQSVDWQLAKPTMAESLTLHLLEASMHSCCFHLPAFHLFAPQVETLKASLNNLDIQGQVIVAILASLGARASPHSALLGVAGPDLNIEKVKAPRDFVLSAGTRRENAWRALADRAVNLSSQMQILQVPTKQNIEVLVALIQMLMLSKVKPVKSRFFLRNVAGMFQDLQRSCGLSVGEVLAIKRTVGATLFECDARVAAYSSSPLVVSESDIEEYFEGTGVIIPDLESDSLGHMLDSIFETDQSPVTRQKVDDALALSGYYICALQRQYSKIATARPGKVDYYSILPRFWSWVDSAHAAVQALHRRLNALKLAGIELPGSDHDVEYDQLISVRMDARLIDLLNLTHEFLRRKLNPENPAEELHGEERTRMLELFALSEKRVRKCLKLLAFYAKLFVESRDKHLVFHLFVQLEALPTWAYMAPQRIGEMTAAGPLTEECQLSEMELDWFASGLELACFFTPLASMRLHELTEGRRAREKSEMSMLDYSYAPADSHSATPTPTASLATITSPPQQVYSSISPEAPPNLLAAPLPAPSIFPPPPAPSQPILSPYTFDAYGNPSLDLGRGSPAPHSHPHSHGHPHAANGHTSSHGGHSSAISQETWLQGLDFDAMIGGAGGRQPAYQQPHHQQQQQQQQYQNHQQQQPRYGQQQQQWMGGTGAADLSEPFDEGGRWGVSLNQW